MTGAIVHGVDLGDSRTHVERLDLIDAHSHEIGEPVMAEAEDLPPTEWTAEGHPAGERWPYRTLVKSISAQSIPIPPNSIVDLLPHEVGRHCVLAKDVLEARQKAASEVEPPPAPEPAPEPEPAPAEPAPAPEPVPAPETAAPV